MPKIKNWSTHTHKHTRISYQFIFLSTNPSCSTDFSRHLRLHPQSNRIGSLPNRPLLLPAHTIVFRFTQTYFIMPSTFVLSLQAFSIPIRHCVINVTHVVIDFMCERNEFVFLLFFFFLFYLRSKQQKRKKNEWNNDERQFFANDRQSVLRIVDGNGGGVGVPLKCDVSYCQFTWYALQKAKEFCYPTHTHTVHIDNTNTVVPDVTHMAHAKAL